MKSIHENYNQIDYSDGISREEAVAIVQKMYIDGGIPEEARSKVGLTFPIARLNGRKTIWTVILTDRGWDFFHSYIYQVLIDASTGEVLDQDLFRDNIPIFVPIPISG